MKFPRRIWALVTQGKGSTPAHRNATHDYSPHGVKPVMPTCDWYVGEDPVHGSKRVSCVGLNVWLVGNTICPFCQKHIEWRMDDTASRN